MNESGSVIKSNAGVTGLGATGTGAADAGASGAGAADAALADMGTADVAATGAATGAAPVDEGSAHAVETGAGAFDAASADAPAADVPATDVPAADAPAADVPAADVPAADVPAADVAAADVAAADVAATNVSATDLAASGAPAASRTQLVPQWVGLFAVCALITLAIQWNRIIPLSGAWGWGGDEGQMLWNLWVVHWGAIHGTNPLLTHQVFFPDHTNLTHHSLASGFLPLTVLVDLLSGHDPLYPFITLRVATWLCYTLTLTFTFSVLRLLGFGLLEAAIPALGYAFCSFYEHHLHLTLLSGWFIPLDALMVLRWWQKPTSARATAAAFCFGLGVYFSEFSLFCAVALLLASVLMLCHREGRRGLWQRLRATGLRGSALACVIALATAAPFLITFARAEKVELPGIDAHRAGSSDLLGPVVPTRMWGDQPSTLLYGHVFEPLAARIRNSTESFVGFPLLLLALIGALGWRRNPAVVNGAAIMALIFYVLMLGPTLHVRGHNTMMSLPYRLLIRVPPFNIQRTPVRLVAFLGFCLTVVAAQGAAWLRAMITGPAPGPVNSARAFYWREAAAAVAMAGMLTWAFAESYNPHTAYPTYQPPAALAQFATARKASIAPVASLPIGNLGGEGYAEMLQIFHHRPSLTGYLARNTLKQHEVYLDLMEAYRSGPDAFTRYLRKHGADTILVMPGDPDDFYSPPCSLLAQLASRTQIVDMRFIQPKLVADLGTHNLTNGEASNAPGTIDVEDGKDLLLTCQEPVRADRLELLAEANAACDVALLSHGATVGNFTARRVLEGPGLQWRCLVFQATEFDAVRITPHQGPAVLAIGRLTAWGS